MAKKKEISKDILELKGELEKDSVCIGTKEVLRELRSGNLNKIYLASNCPSEIKKDIEHYVTLSKVPVVFLKINNEELGGICKKHFFISVLGIKKK